MELFKNFAKIRRKNSPYWHGTGERLLMEIALDLPIPQGMDIRPFDLLFCLTSSRAKKLVGFSCSCEERITNNRRPGGGSRKLPYSHLEERADHTATQDRGTVRKSPFRFRIGQAGGTAIAHLIHQLASDSGIRCCACEL